MFSWVEDKVFPGVSQKGNTVRNLTADQAWFAEGTGLRCSFEAIGGSKLKLDLYRVKDGLGGGDFRTGRPLTIYLCVTSGFTSAWTGNGCQFAPREDHLFRPTSLQNDQLGFLPDPFHLQTILPLSKHGLEVQIRHLLKKAHRLSLFYAKLGSGMGHTAEVIYMSPHFPCFKVGVRRAPHAEIDQ